MSKRYLLRLGPSLILRVKVGMSAVLSGQVLCLVELTWNYPQAKQFLTDVTCHVMVPYQYHRPVVYSFYVKF